MATLCDLCGVWPATVRATVVSDGEEEILNLCDVDYRRLAREQARAGSPLESLFGGRAGSLFDEFFAGEAFGGGNSGRRWSRRGAPSDDDRPQTGRRGTAHGIGERLSTQAEEILQRAARRAMDIGRPEVDMEHLLYALSESDVVRTILEQFKLSADDLCGQLDEAESGRGREVEKGRVDYDLGVSPRVKDALGRAFVASRDLGHSYVGPEHLLIGLAEESEGVASETLRRYGLTPQALRQQVVKVVGRGAEEGRVDAPTNTPNLDKYSRDLTRLAREGKLDPVIGRAQEIETTIEVLARRKKTNPGAARRRRDGGSAFRLNPEHGRLWLVLSGLLSIVFGVLLAIAPLIGAIVLTWWLGAYALLFGASLLVLAMRLRKSRGESKPGSPAPQAA
jgi:ATP-dependent Clp protease ATP-binding subunit ClpC